MTRLGDETCSHCGWTYRVDVVNGKREESGHAPTCRYSPVQRWERPSERQAEEDEEGRGLRV